MEIQSNNKKYSLLIIIINKGSTDLVMNAARKAGSTGGTIAVARGTGNPNVAKFYGIAIQPEKEMVFIVVDLTFIDIVMILIYDDGGFVQLCIGIIFSLPITDAVGFDPLPNIEDIEQKLLEEKAEKTE